MSWFSSYPDGHRFVFIETTLQIADVHSPSMKALDLTLYSIKTQFSMSGLVKMENVLLTAEEIERIETIGR